MAIRPNEALERLPEYNSGFYDQNSNPFGMADGGHIINFPLSLSDLIMVIAFIEALAGEADADATTARGGATSAAAARDVAQRWAANPENEVVREGLFSALHYARKAAASAIEAAKFDPALFVRRDGSQAMTSLLRLAASTANNGSLIIPAGSATPAGAALADGVVWGDGSNIIWRLGGTTRVARDSRPGSIPNANLENMPGGTVKMRRPGTGAGAPVDATLVQLIADLGFLSDLSENGYIQLPGGFYAQWGFSANGNMADYSYSFPRAFPNACLFTVCSHSSIPPDNYMYSVSADSWSRFAVAFRKRLIVGPGSVVPTSDGVVIRYFSIGF